MDQLEEILWKITCVTVCLSPSVCISMKKDGQLFFLLPKDKR